MRVDSHCHVGRYVPHQVLDLLDVKACLEEAGAVSVPNNVGCYCGDASERTVCVEPKLAEGLSLRKIKCELESCEIKSPYGKPTWGVETIRRILENEKYKGHVLLQKTYVSNFVTGKRTNNGGELPKYLIKCHHEAIIDSEDF